MSYPHELLGIDSKDQFKMAGETINIKQLLKEYDDFVDEHYQTHPDKQKFKSEVKSFDNYDEFKNSSFYQLFSEDDRKKIAQFSGPIKITILRFGSDDDALKFFKDMEEKNIVRKGTAEQLFKEQPKEAKQFRSQKSDQPEETRLEEERPRRRP